MTMKALVYHGPEKISIDDVVFQPLSIVSKLT